MYTLCLGSPLNPTLVFLHGFMGTGEDWLPIAKHLSQNFYCLLPDLPGHGASPLDSNPSYETWSEELKGMILDKNIERISLLGYSLGGRLALYFNLANPEKVTQLVIESANPGISDSYERLQRATRDQVLSERILENGIESFLNEWYDLPLFESLNRYPALKAELRRKRGQQCPKDLAAVLSALSPGQQPDLWPLLSDIQVPTLLISGRLDQKYTSIMREMNQVFPNSQMILLDDCGHNVHRECPDRYLKELRDWLYQFT